MTFKEASELCKEMAAKHGCAYSIIRTEKGCEVVNTKELNAQTRAAKANAPKKHQGASQPITDDYMEALIKCGLA